MFACMCGSTDAKQILTGEVAAEGVSHSNRCLFSPYLAYILIFSLCYMQAYIGCYSGRHCSC